MKIFSLIRISLRILKAIYLLSERLKSLDETLIAQTVLVNQKPINLLTIDTIDINTVTSPLLRDLLLSRARFMSSKPEIVLGHNKEDNFDAKLHQAWRDMRDEVVGE